MYYYPGSRTRARSVGHECRPGGRYLDSGSGRPVLPPRVERRRRQNAVPPPPPVNIVLMLRRLGLRDTAIVAGFLGSIYVLEVLFWALASRGEVNQKVVKLSQLRQTRCRASSMGP